jgi:hypothetical protein
MSLTKALKNNDKPPNGRVPPTLPSPSTLHGSASGLCVPQAALSETVLALRTRVLLTRYSAAQQRPGRSRCQVESGTSDVRTSDESTRLETTQKVLSCERAARSISVRARDSSTSTRDQRCSASARRACRRHALSHTGERDAALSGSLARWRVEWVREMSASGHAQTAMWWWRRTRRRKETEREAEEWR